MSQNFLPYDRDQQFLMPPSLRDWLPADHLAWFVADAVAQMDLSAFYAAYRRDGWGHAAYEPALLVALLLYAYCDGERSSRRIERRCREDIAFRVLAANQVPDHTTICRFRQTHEAALAGLFGEVLRLCVEAGMVRVGVVALDGTKLHANASREANRDSAQIEAEVRRILAEAAQVDAEEDARFGEERGDELPPWLRHPQQRLAQLRAAKERLAARERERQEGYEERLRQRAAKDPRGRKPRPPAPEPEAKVNLTDPESRVVRDYHGYLQGYNVQAATTREQIIVAAELTREATDVGALQPMLAALRGSLAAVGVAPPRVLLADAGYYSDANVRAVGAGGPELVIATRSARHQRQAVSPRGRIPSALSLRERIRRKLATKRGRRLYAQRQWMIEPVFGDIKENRGIRRFMRRGFAACASEWKLVAATHNLNKLYRQLKATGSSSTGGGGGRLMPALG